MYVINIIIPIGNAALLAHAVKIKTDQEDERDGLETMERDG